jgi:hypothetical protein
VLLCFFRFSLFKAMSKRKHEEEGEEVVEEEEEIVETHELPNGLYPSTTTPKVRTATVTEEKSETDLTEDDDGAAVVHVGDDDTHPSVDLSQIPPGITRPITRADIPIPALDSSLPPITRAVGKHPLIPIKQFQATVGASIVDPQKRAKFSGVITHLGVRLTKVVDVTEEQATIELAQRIQPAHLGEACTEDPSGRCNNFVVDADGAGYWLSRDLLCNVVKLSQARYQYEKKPISMEFVVAMSNRMWCPGDTLASKRRRPILPDTFYYRRYSIHVDLPVTSHKHWRVCKELQYQCHPQAQQRAEECKRQKSDRRQKVAEGAPDMDALFELEWNTHQSLLKRVALARTQLLTRMEHDAALHARYVNFLKRDLDEHAKFVLLLTRF